MADAALIAKWKKPGYERLCSTYVINTKNYKFGTVSICRVPKHALGPDTVVEDPFTGCLGCASGPGGQRNIFGNKYGQYLAAIQVARDEERGRRDAAKLTKAAKDAEERAAEAAASAASGGGQKRAAEDEDTDEEGGGGSDSDGEGPMPATPWAVTDAERAMETADTSEADQAAAQAAGSKYAAAGSSKYAAGATPGGGDSDAKRPRY